MTELYHMFGYVFAMYSLELSFSGTIVFDYNKLKRSGIHTVEQQFSVRCTALLSIFKRLPD